MDISTMERTKFSCFDSIEDKRKRNECINAMKYVKRLASVSNTDIHGWDLIKMFKRNDSDVMVISDKNQINKIFFTQRESAPIETTALSFDQCELLKRLEAYSTSRRSNVFKNQAEAATRTAASHYAAYITQMRVAAEKWSNYEAIVNYKPNFIQQVSEVEAGGFWKLEMILAENQSIPNGLYGPLIMFDTRNDIILSYVNKKFGAKYTVNLGKFRVALMLAERQVYVHQLENNIVAGGHVHPHISGDGRFPGHPGTFCFGEMREEQHVYIAQMNIPKIMELCQLTLCTYNEGNPYRVLEEFKKIRDLEEEKNGEAKKKKEAQGESQAEEDGEPDVNF